MWKSKNFLVSFAIWLIFSTPALAQVSTNVNLSDPDYRKIDKLIGFGLIKNVIVGQRPYSRIEMARLVAEAKKNFTQHPKLSENNYLKNIFADLEKQYQQELKILSNPKETPLLRVKWIDQLHFKQLSSNAPDQTIPNTPLGITGAVYNSFLQHDEGRHWVTGQNFSLESEHELSLSRYFGLKIQPRFQLAFRETKGSRHEAQIHHLYSKINLFNFEIEVGRDHLFWGQGNDSSLLLGNNARGLDMIKISNDKLFRWPGFLKHIGNNKYTFFYADLGPEQVFPHSYLAGFKFSFQPNSWFEIGMSNLDISGGDGSPTGSIWDRIGNVLPLKQLVSGNQDQIDNKLGGFDVRFRIPKALGMEVYLEAIFEDTPGGVKTFLLEDAGYLGGIFFPRLGKSGNMDLRLEYHRTGIRHYRHHQFSSGWALNGYLLADPLGSDGHGGYVDFNWDVDSKNLINFKTAFEIRSQDFYSGPRSLYGEFIRVQNFPEEVRLRFQTQWQHHMEKLPLRLTLQAGYEWVHNINYVFKEDAHHFVSSVSMDYQF
ncbi:MAG: hypothetical protein HYU97_05370 [Deltaproteobacteria bacterium]|nr:hypothetical protein [Deltaproteobacteria bacterium]